MNHRVKLVVLPLGPVCEGRIDQGPALDITDLDREGPTGMVELAVSLENLVKSVFEIAKLDFSCSTGRGFSWFACVSLWVDGAWSRAPVLDG